MANKNIFARQKNVVNTPVADTQNAAGGAAYRLDAKRALALIASTNCFNGTFYASAGDNLDLAKQQVKLLKDDPEYIAKVAVYAREKSYMKDMPAYLVAVLASLDDGKKPPHNDRILFRKAFRRVIDNGVMLRSFVQIARSGQAGKILNLSSGAVRSAINEWFESKSPRAIFKASIGNDPSLRNILRMSRPRPSSPEKAALLAYIMTDLTNTTFDPSSRNVDGNVFDPTTRSFRQHRRDKNGEWRIAHEASWDMLPTLIREYEEFRSNRSGAIPSVDFRLLTDLKLTREQWSEVARNAPWTMTRMNLNTFARHGVFEDPEMVRLIADRLRNRDDIVNSKVFPYQLLAAYRAIQPAADRYGVGGQTDSVDIPADIQDALHDALEISCANIPEMKNLNHVAVDVSGSMSSSITGFRAGSTSRVRCIDVAALFATAVARQKNHIAVYPFDTRVHHYRPERRNTILTEADRLARFGGGGTNCALVLSHLNQVKASGDVLLISDCESWVNSGYYGSGTYLMNEWAYYAGRNPGARLICMDLTPRDNSQVSPRSDILQVGGFSDKVFDVVASFLDSRDDDHWVSEIERIEL